MHSGWRRLAKPSSGVAIKPVRARPSAFAPGCGSETSQTTSIDIAPGIVVAGSGAPGFSGHAGLNFADYAGLTMHVVALRPEQFDVDRSTRVAVFAGGRLASVPGTILGVGGPLAVGAAFLIACGSGSCFGN